MFAMETDSSSNKPGSSVSCFSLLFTNSTISRMRPLSLNLVSHLPKPLPGTNSGAFTAEAEKLDFTVDVSSLQPLGTNTGLFTALNKTSFSFLFLFFSPDFPTVLPMPASIEQNGKNRTR